MGMRGCPCGKKPTDCKKSVCVRRDGGTPLAPIKNTGVASQTNFEGLFIPYGKRAFIHRVTDTKEIVGMNKRVGIFTKPQPSDYIVTVRDFMFYAEVKSTHQARFPRKKFTDRKGQHAAMVQQIAAGGSYLLFIHFVRTNNWYIMPGADFLKSPAKSWSEDDLAAYRIADFADPVYRRHGRRRDNGPVA